METIKTITFKHVVGTIIMIAFIVGHIALLYKAIPPENENPFIHSLGMLDTAVALLVGYYFGSSSGSKAKSEVIEEELSKKP
jgi:hypothetical protein